MKKIFASILLSMVLVTGFSIFAAPTAEARVGVRGHYRNNGTYVAPYYRSNPDSYRSNNWNSRYNYNPYTGKKGYRNW